MWLFLYTSVRHVGHNPPPPNSYYVLKKKNGRIFKVSLSVVLLIARYSIPVSIEDHQGSPIKIAAIVYYVKPSKIKVMTQFFFVRARDASLLDTSYEYTQLQYVIWLFVRCTYILQTQPGKQAYSSTKANSLGQDFIWQRVGESEGEMLRVACCMKIQQNWGTKIG